MPAAFKTEQQRLAHLRAQRNEEAPLPLALQHLLENGRLPPWKTIEARAIWQSTCEGLALAPSYEAAELLVSLTAVISTHLDLKKEADRVRYRAGLQSALDAVTLPRHRQIVLARLSRQASAEADLSAAERWLALCDPHSDDLHTDTEYRIARALLDTSRQEWQAVLSTLGRRFDEVPIWYLWRTWAIVLRSNAFENLGQLPDATAVLRSAKLDTTVEVMDQWPFPLCVRARAQAEQDQSLEEQDQAITAAFARRAARRKRRLGAALVILAVLCFGEFARLMSSDLPDAWWAGLPATFFSGFAFLIVGIDLWGSNPDL